LNRLDNADSQTAKLIIREALNQGTDILNIAKYKNGLVIVTGKNIRPENIKTARFKKPVPGNLTEILKNPFFFPKEKGYYKIIIIKEK